jgi:hypothetical protein
MLDEIMNTLEEMRQERNEFHDVVIKRFTKKVTTMRQEMRQESQPQEIAQQEKYDRLSRSYTSLKERNRVLTKENRVLEQLSTEENGRLFIAEYETYEARQELRRYKQEVKDETHSHKISINCALELDHYDFIGYTSGTCDGCEFKKKKWVILAEKRFDEILIKNEICTKKEANHDKVVLQLRQLNVSLTQRLKEMRTNHSKSQAKFERRIKTLKTEVDMSTRRLTEFKANFKARLDESVIKTKDLDVERLIETYQTHTDNIHTLKQYAIVEQFINDMCYERTGLKRNYKAYPPIYNNIYDLVGLKGIESFLSEAFSLTVAEFMSVFMTLKNDRISIAHPTVGKIDIESVQQIVKQRQ